MPIASLEITHLSCFKILQKIPILISKLVHDNSITDIKWNTLKTPGLGRLDKAMYPFIGLGS